MAVTSPMPGVTLPDAISKIGIAIIIGMLGYLGASIQDRYSATTAKNDREVMLNHIAEVESRMRLRITEHHNGPPHENVDQRLTRVETTLEVALNTLTEEVRLLRAEWNSERAGSDR